MAFYYKNGFLNARGAYTWYLPFLSSRKGELRSNFSCLEEKYIMGCTPLGTGLEKIYRFL